MTMFLMYRVHMAMKTMDVKTSVAANVKRLRHRAGMTQEELAIAIGVSWRVTGAIERVRHELPLDMLVRLANIFEVPLAALLKPAKLPKATPGRPKGSTYG